MHGYARAFQRFSAIDGSSDAGKCTQGLMNPGRTLIGVTTNLFSMVANDSRIILLSMVTLKVFQQSNNVQGLGNLLINTYHFIP